MGTFYCLRRPSPVASRLPQNIDGERRDLRFADPRVQLVGAAEGLVYGEHGQTENEIVSWSGGPLPCVTANGAAELGDQTLQVAAAVLRGEGAERNRRRVRLAVGAHTVPQQDREDARTSGEQVADGGLRVQFQHRRILHALSARILARRCRRALDGRQVGDQGCNRLHPPQRIAESGTCGSAPTATYLGPFGAGRPLVRRKHRRAV